MISSAWTSWSDEDLLEHLDDAGMGLSNWELNFLENMLEIVHEEGRSLTRDQRGKLIEIIEARCS